MKVVFLLTIFFFWAMPLWILLSLLCVLYLVLCIFGSMLGIATLINIGFIVYCLRRLRLVPDPGQLGPRFLDVVVFSWADRRWDYCWEAALDYYEVYKQSWTGAAYKVVKTTTEDLTFLGSAAARNADDYFTMLEVASERRSRNAVRAQRRRDDDDVSDDEDVPVVAPRGFLREWALKAVISELRAQFPDAWRSASDASRVSVANWASRMLSDPKGKYRFTPVEINNILPAAVEAVHVRTTEQAAYEASRIAPWVRALGLEYRPK